MLVLSRKVGEKIVLKMNGVKVVVEVMQTSRTKIRIGIDAPMDVSIWREELNEKKEKIDGDSV